MDIRDMQYNLDVGSTKILVAKAAFAKIHSQHLYMHGFSCKNGTRPGSHILVFELSVY
jgi:hypothetical protein